MRALVALLFLSQIGLASAQTLTPGDAFNLGKSTGAAGTQDMFNNVNSARAGEVMKGYTETAPQSSYWGGGQTVLGTLQGGGSSKVVECGSGTVTGAEDKQHCEAVNLLANQYKYRPANIIPKGDPLLNAGRGVTNNPDAIAGSLGGGLTNCTTKVVQNPASFSIETCDDFSSTQDGACVMGQEVIVDPDYFYQCHETIKTISSGSCTYGEVVQVDAKTNYQCTKSPYQTNTYTCNRTNNVTVTQQCQNQWTTRTWTPPTGPYGHAISSYDDFRNGPNDVCSYMWPGSTTVNYSCGTLSISCSGEGEYVFCQANNVCDYRHNGAWGTGSCPDQNWCVQGGVNTNWMSAGIGSLTCGAWVLNCWNVITVNTSNGCTTLEARS